MQPDDFVDVKEAVYLIESLESNQPLLGESHLFSINSTSYFKLNC